MNEHTHTKQCLAGALKSAIENFRDYDEVSDVEFRLLVQDGQILREADTYLADMVGLCRCGATEYNKLWHEVTRIDPNDEEASEEFINRVRRTLNSTNLPDIAPQYLMGKLFAYMYDAWSGGGE
jgi:hypothetical protein